MYILRIEHVVKDLAEWKKTFDNDPIGREKHGVLRYRLSHPVDNSSYAIIELDLNTREEAEMMLVSLKQVWSKIVGDVIMEPSTDILYVIEAKELATETKVKI